MTGTNLATKPTGRSRLPLGLGLAALWCSAYLAVFYSVRSPATGIPRVMAALDTLGAAVTGPRGQPVPVVTGHGVSQRLWIALTAAAILAGGTGWGLVGLRLLRLRAGMSGTETAVLAFALGTALLSAITLIGGLFGVMHRMVFSAILAAGPVAAMAWRPARSHRRADETGSGGRPTRFRHWVLLLAAVPLVLLILLAAMLPPDAGHDYFDIKEYHLQAPKEFFLHGKITFLPHNVYTSMPLGTEMLSLLAMIVTGDWWWGALVGQSVLAVFAPMTALLLAEAGRRFFTPVAGAVAALLFLATPAVFEVTSTAYVEGGLCFYTAAALYSAARLHIGRRNDGQTGANTTGMASLVGVLAGAAAACKYPGTLYCVLPAGVFCLLPRPMMQEQGGPTAVAKRSFRPIRIGALFLGGVLLTFGPWLLRNVWDTGNPVYPLLWSVFGGKSWTFAQDAQWWRVHGPPGFTVAHFQQSAAQVLVGRAELVRLNPLLFALAPIAVLAPKRRRRAICLIGYAVYILAVWWVCTHRIDRFWYPVIPSLALLAGAGATWCPQPMWKKVMTLVISVGLFAGFAQSATSHPRWPDFGWRLSRIDLEAARHEFTKGPVRFLNEQLPSSATVLVVGEAAVFDLRQTLFYNTAFDDSMLGRWIEQGGNWPARAAEHFARLGITYVYVDWGEVARYRSAGNYGYSDAITPKNVHALVERGVVGPPLQWRYPVETLAAASQQVFVQWGQAAPTYTRGQEVTVYALYPVRDRP